jgi:hypothetical protein
MLAQQRHQDELEAKIEGLCSQVEFFRLRELSWNRGEKDCSSFRVSAILLSMLKMP